MGKSFAPYCFDKISEAMAWCPQKALQSLRNKPKTLSLSSQSLFRPLVLMYSVKTAIVEVNIDTACLKNPWYS